MIDNELREKVINKVTAIVADMQEEVDEWKDYSDSELRGGLTCDCDWWYKTLQTLKDALAMLKAEKPKVLTLEEVLATEVVYVEDIDKAEIIPVLVSRRVYDRIVLVKAHLTGVHVFYPLICEYGKYWRCWTSRPDEKRRAETPWND